MEKGIKAYHSYLSFGDAKEALSETVCEDLNLDDLCEQLDYTSSCVGRQYLYHILCTDKISDVTAHEQFIEQLQTDYLLRNKLVNALQKLNKPDAYSIVDILAEKNIPIRAVFIVAPNMQVVTCCISNLDVSNSFFTCSSFIFISILYI